MDTLPQQSPPPASVPPPAAPPKKKSTTTVILIVVGVVALGCCGIMGVLAAIAVPNFLKFQARAKQSECKMNLKAMYTAQRAHFAEKDDFSEKFEDLGFAPERNRRYTYFMGPTAKIAGDHPEAKSSTEQDVANVAGETPPGVWDDCPDECFFVGACAGNLDRDATLDVWSISSQDRERNGESIPAGVPFHDVDDLQD